MTFFLFYILLDSRTQFTLSHLMMFTPFLPLSILSSFPYAILFYACPSSSSQANNTQSKHLLSSSSAVFFLLSHYYSVFQPHPFGRFTNVQIISFFILFLEYFNHSLSTSPCRHPLFWLKPSKVLTINSEWEKSEKKNISTKRMKKGNRLFLLRHKIYIYK